MKYFHKFLLNTRYCRRRIYQLKHNINDTYLYCIIIDSNIDVYITKNQAKPLFSTFYVLLLFFLQVFFCEIRSQNIFSYKFR